MAEGYDPDKFYTHSTDKKGHSKTMRFSVPPDVLYQANNYVADRKLPYMNLQEFLRDAIVHRLNQLSELNPDDPRLHDLAAYVTRQAERATKMAIIEASDQTVVMYRELAQKARSVEEREQLCQDIRDELADAKAMRLNSDAVDKLKDLLRQLMYGAIG